MNYRNAHEPFAYALASNIPSKRISNLYTYLNEHTFIHIFIDIIYFTPYSSHILNLALRPSRFFAWANGVWRHGRRVYVFTLGVENGRRAWT